MKRIYYSAITGPDHARQMGEIMEAPYGDQWDGDTAAYLENLDPAPAYLEGAEHIPGDVQQYFTDAPTNICVELDAERIPVAIWWSDTGDPTPEGREKIDALWEAYCAGDLPDAPAPVFDD